MRAGIWSVLEKKEWLFNALVFQLFSMFEVFRALAG